MTTFAPPAGDRGYPLVLARNFTPVAPESQRRIDLVVLHDMEAREATDTAERCAAYFAGQPRQGVILQHDWGPSWKAGQVFEGGSSAHYCVDADSVVQSVLERDVAWHAPGANRNGIGIEQAGRASQGPRDWEDDYSQRVILNAANLAGAICLAYQVPLEFVSEAGLLAGQRGITTHACVSRAFRKSAHSDPGPSYPIALFLELCRAGAVP